MKKPSANELIEAVRLAGAATVLHPGPGWLSTREVADQIQLSDVSTRRRLNDMLRRGEVETAMVRLPHGGKGSYWRLIPKNGKGKR